MAPEVLDNDIGEKVLVYGDDSGTRRKVLVDSSGRIIAVINNTSGPFTVTATNLDIRDLVKAQDEVYAVLRTDAGAAYDARRIQGLDGSTQRQPKVDSTARFVTVPEWDAHAEGSYDDTVGNHADTTRFDVTLATTTAGRLISLFFWIDALTTNQAAFSYVTLDPQGAGVGNQILGLMFGVTTGITTLTLFPNIDLRPGDRLTGHTSNSDGSNRRFIVRATWLLRTI